MELEIVAIADYFDNVMRSCSNPEALDEAMEQVRQQAGRLFHPRVVKALMKVALEDEGGHLCGPSVP